LAAEDNVERFFQRAGFEVLYAEGVPWLEQVRRFAAAEVIAGLHGAGLANLVFAPPDATLLELFPPDYFNDCYARLAVTAGLRYRFFNLDEATLADDRTLTTALTAWLA
jgi:capsular polysaccharide biosynthesis protein